MSTKSGIYAKVGLIAASVLFSAASAGAQESTGPLFSTPAQRSTVGSPILSDPNARQNGEVIGNTGRGQAGTGRAQAPAPARSEKAAPQAAEASAAQSAKFKEWDLQCAQVTKDQKRCQIVGNVLSGDGRQVILVMALATAADGKAMATQIAVPLGISLKAGVKIDVSGAYTTTMAASRCTSQGCLAEGNVEPALIEAMKTRPAATITVATPDGKAIPIKLPLDGFGDAYAAMQASDKGAPQTSKAK
jgi:invasion protein IalB